MNKTEIKRNLRILSEKDGPAETKAFAQDILDLIDELEKEADRQYFQGKAEGMEILAQIMCGSTSDE